MWRNDSFATGLLLGFATATAVSCVYYRQKQGRDEPLAATAHPTTATASDKESPATDFTESTRISRIYSGLGLDDVVISEQLTRNIQFFGEDAVKRLWDCHVVVIGLGGVGSHAAHMLLRSGIGRLTLVDFDQVTVSSLNRHAVATRADVGLPKATVLADHFKEILPEAAVTAKVMMYTADNEAQILDGNPDFVLDAIDNLDTKVNLIAACKRRGLPVLCLGGAGAKSDPTKLRFVDIVDGSHDPLIRSVRYHLRRRHGVSRGVDVLLSTEKPRCGLVTTEEQANADSILEYQTIPNFRIRSIPVLGTSPSIFGMAAASWILCQLAGQPFLPEPVLKFERKQYETLLETLHEDEERRLGHCDDVAVDAEEVTFIVSHVWRGLSAHDLGHAESDKGKGRHRRTAGLVLLRYDVDQPCMPSNLVLLREEEAARLRDLGLYRWRETYPAVAKFAEKAMRRVEGIFGTVE